MIEVLIVAALYGVLFTTVELIVRKTSIEPAVSRKVVHIISGLVAACLPIFMSFNQIAVASFLFIPIMIVSKKMNLFSSIHQVKRRTNGEIYFPLAVLIVALFAPSKVVYVYGVLVMALGDGFATIIGQRYGRHKYRLGATTKSYEGSLTFFGLAALTGIISLAYTDASAIVIVGVALVLAMILTFAEAFLSYGLDNLVIAPAASLLFWLSIGLFNLN